MISKIYGNNLYATKKKKQYRPVKYIFPKSQESEYKKNDGFYETRAWLELRYKALKKHGRRCMCCGASPKDGIVLHVDHVLPRSKHKHLELCLDNLQVLCNKCNLGKSNKFTDDFR